jgi:DNA-binding GntR family transcriptional regulator
VQDKPTKDEIHAELRERILLLDLPAGARLREERLAAHFGVSRTPIRQVLDRLEFEGLVTQGDRGGARVSHLDTKSLRDIWTLRLRLADTVGDFVRLPAGTDLIEQLRQLRTDVESVRGTRDLTELGRLYNRFHEIMLGTFQNEALVRIQDLLYVQTARVWMQFLPEMDIEREIDVMAEEVDQTTEALAGTSGAHLARIRAEHMRRLLRRFNDQVTALPDVPI